MRIIDVVVFAVDIVVVVVAAIRVDDVAHIGSYGRRESSDAIFPQPRVVVVVVVVVVDRRRSRNHE